MPARLMIFTELEALLDDLDAVSSNNYTNALPQNY